MTQWEAAKLDDACKVPNPCLLLSGVEGSTVASESLVVLNANLYHSVDARMLIHLFLIIYD